MGQVLRGESLLATLDGPKHDFKPVYLLAGENALLRDRILERMRDLAVPAAWRSSNLETLWADEVGENEVADLAGTPPFGGDRRMIVVRGAEWYRGGGEKKKGRPRKPAEADSPLIQFVKAPFAGTLLVLVSDVWDAAKWESDALGKAVRASGVLAACDPVEEAMLSQWLQVEARSVGVGLEPAAARELIERCGREPLALRRELEKLACYAGDGKSISAADVQAITGEQVFPSIFDFLNALFNSPGRALSALSRLLVEMHPLALHGIMLMQVRKLVLMKGALAEGLSAGQVAGRVKLPFSVVGRLDPMVRKTHPARFARLLMALASAEAALKRPAGRNELERGRYGREVLERMVRECCR